MEIEGNDEANMEKQATKGDSRVTQGWLQPPMQTPQSAM